MCTRHVKRHRSTNGAWVILIAAAPCRVVVGFVTRSSHKSMPFKDARKLGMSLGKCEKFWCMLIWQREIARQAARALKQWNGAWQLRFAEHIQAVPPNSGTPCMHRQ